MVENESMIALAPILHLPPVNKEQMTPYPLARYLDLLNEIYEEVPLNELCEDDLIEEEKAKRKESTDKIMEWVRNCSKDSSQAALMIYPYSMVIADYLRDLNRILKTAYERKAEKQRQEAEKQRRLAVLKEMDPPLTDAEKYLTPEEDQKFLDSIPGAIDAYLSRDRRAESYSPGIWLLNSKASGYSYWILIIKEHKEKETREKRAQIERDQYIDRLSAAVEKFKAELGKSEKPKFVHPPELVKCEPDNWCDVELPTKQRIQNWAAREILGRLPEILSNLTKWELGWQLQVLPCADYEVIDGIPCLTWHFYSHILATASLELKRCVIRKRYPVGYMDVESEGEKLGVLYLEQNEWLTPGTFITPIALLSLLAKGDLEGPGITVAEHGFPFTTFAVQGFEEEVKVYDDFRKYIRNIAKDQPLADALLAKGLIDEDTAKLVEKKTALPLPQALDTGQAFSDDSDVISELEALGYKTKELMEAMEVVSLSPDMFIKEKIAAVLEILNKNTS